MEGSNVSEAKRLNVEHLTETAAVDSHDARHLPTTRQLYDLHDKYVKNHLGGRTLAGALDVRYLAFFSLI